MRVIETSVFARQADALIGDDEKQALLDLLVDRPDAGDLIKGSGGLRKLRWAADGRGKSGGIRVIYYWCAGELIYLLLAYPKKKQDDLTPAQLKALREVVREEKDSWKRNSSAS
jgi:hypothetical protein